MTTPLSVRKSICFFFALVFSVPMLQGQSQPSARRLNVLFIAVDDLNNSLGAYGHPVVKTPSIDRLASRGVRFDRAYCQYPLCNPSRTSLLSGRRPETTRIFSNDTPPRTHLKDIVFLPEYFRRHGYFTARVGKIAHGPFENAVAWDISESASGRAEAQTQNQQRPNQQRRDRERNTPGGLPVQWRATNNNDGQEPDGRTARRIVQLLQQNKDKPFFIAAGFHKPHLPWVAPKKYFDRYPPEKIKLPEEPPEHAQKTPPMARTRNPADDRMSDGQKRQAIAAYYACTSFMDAQVGLLLEAMDRLKLWDNTVVVFFGDHGFHLGEHGGLWRKMSLFEESARVPLIIAAPRIRTGVASPRFAEFVDLYPTLTDLAGLPAPRGMEGISLAPLLENPNRPWKKAAFTVVSRGKVFGRSVRTERYRYTEWGDEKIAELYDHQTDPHEHKNLVDDPAHAKALAEMRQLLKDGWRAALPATSDVKRSAS